MAIFKLEIRLDNAAFHDDDGDLDPSYEIGRILDEMSKKAHLMGVKGSVRDVNGNLVGEWRIEE